MLCDSGLNHQTSYKSSDGTLTKDVSEYDVLSDYYSSVFVTEDLDAIPFAVPKTYDELEDMKLTHELIACTPYFTRTFSSLGPDNIPYAASKAGGSLIVRQFCRLFQLFW